MKRKFLALVGAFLTALGLQGSARADDLGVAKPVSANVPVISPSIIIGHGGSGPSCGPNGCAGNDHGNDCNRGGFSAYVDGLYWRVRLDNQDFTIADPNIDAVPDGAVQHLRHGWDSGIRFGFGAVLPSGLDIMAHVTWFQSDGASVLTAPAGTSLLPTRIPANAGLPGILLDRAAARGSLDLDSYDLDFGYRCGDDHFGVRLFAGFRYAKIDSALLTSYSDAGFAALIPAGYTVFEGTKMNAYGLRAGAEGNWHSRGGFGVYGKLAGAVLAGHFENRYIANDAGGVFLGANITDERTQVVPVIEVGAGLSYQRGQFTAQLGYELTTYFNFVQRTNFGDDVQFFNQDRTSGNLGLDGFVLRFGWNY